MSNPNEHNTYSREVRQESNNDANGNTHTNVTRTTETVNNTKVTPNRESYGDGYVHGRVAERSYQQADLAERDNNNAARGLLLGILLASLTAITAGAIWLFNQSNESPTPVASPVVVPNSEPKPSPSPQRETKIIEREKPVFIPVPQQQAPASPAPSPTPQTEKVFIPVPQQQAPASPAPSSTPQQDVNSTTPNTAPQSPATEQAPATQTDPTQPQNQSNSTETQAKPNDTSTNTLPEATLNQPNATPGSTSTSNDAESTGDSAQ